MKWQFQSKVYELWLQFSNLVIKYEFEIEFEYKIVFEYFLPIKLCEMQNGHSIL